MARTRGYTNDPSVGNQSIANTTNAFGGDLIVTGEESISRMLVTNTNTLGNQSLRLRFFTARKTETITQIRIYTGGTAAGATPTLCRVGIYSVAANGDITLTNAIANDTTLFASTNTGYTRSLTASWAKVAGTRYAVGALVVTGATAPAILGATVGQASAGVGLRIGALVAGQADLPNSVVSASLGDSGNCPYVEFLP